MVVRELITKIGFQVDKSGAQAAESQTSKLKSNLSAVGATGAAASRLASGAVHRIGSAAGEAGAQVSAACGVMRSALNSVVGAAGAAGSKIRSVGSGMSFKAMQDRGGSIASGGATLAAGGAAMAAPVGLSIKTAMDFEQGMAKVKAITNSDDQAMQQLTNTARQLGRDTKFSATESAQAMTYLGMAGWNSEQIVSGMPGLLDLAAASGEDLGRTADIISDDLTAFGMSADQAGHMADVFAAASTNSNTNVSMLGETMKYAAPVAGALGYSLEDVSIAAGLMANAGVKGEMAGTSLRSIMTRLIDPPKDAAQALDQLGITMTNADGTMRPFGSVLEEMRTKMQGLSQEERAQMASAIAGTDSLSGFMALINASPGDIDKLSKAINNSDGAAKRMAATMNDTAEGSLLQLKSAVQDLEITMGGALLGTLRGLMDVLRGAANGINEFASAHPRLASAIFVVIAALAALLVVLGTLGVFIGGLMTFIGTVGPIFAAVAGVLAGVFSPVIVAIIAITAALYVLYAYWDEVVAGISAGASSVMQFLGEIADTISGAVNGAIQSLRDIGVSAFNAVAGAINTVCDVLGTAWDLIKSVAGGIADLIGKAAEFIGMQGSISATDSSLSAGINNYGGNSQTNIFNVGSVDEAVAGAGAMGTELYGYP